MKKIYVVLAVLATAALASCQQEKSFNEEKLGENSIVFTFQGATATRSAESMVKQGVSIPLDKVDNRMLSLVETVTDLNAASPATKGTPAYTENVGTLYKDNLFVTASGFGDATFENMDDKLENGGWRYYHNYNGDKWPADGTAVDFYLQMPADVTSYGVSARPTYNEGKISFSYTSKTTAAQQRDLIFSYRSLTKKQHNDYLPEGAPVLFHHALTGVKFRIYNDATDLEEKKITKITNVAFIGLKNTGSCVITPRKEKDQEDYTDNKTGDYSSGDETLTTGTVAWTGTSASSATNRIEQSFTESQNMVDFNADDDNNFAPSFYEGGETQNLNAADASLTFWLIPQDFSDAVKLEIQFEMDGELRTIVLPFGEALANANVTWKAGELRTYSIKLDEVNVMIDDEVHMTEEGDYKDNVVITNTGDTDAFIRATLVGQWITDAGDPVFGFTDEVFDLKEVASWYEDQFINTNHTQGTFSGLVGYNGAQSNYWVKGADGYYYYIYAVPANNGTIPGDYIDPSTGATTKVNDDVKKLQPLFSKYTIGTAPDSQIAALDVTIHFELEIATQAISAMKTDGSYLTWEEAWTKALGYNPKTTDPITAN